MIGAIDNPEFIRVGCAGIEAFPIGDVDGAVGRAMSHQDRFADVLDPQVVAKLVLHDQRDRQDGVALGRDIDG